MKPRPIRTRADLVRVIAHHCPTRACERAVSEGRTTVLGGFTPPGDFPQWIVEVESERGNRWYIAIKCDEETYRFVPHWYQEADLPWAYWDGTSNGSRLVDGERPRTSALRRTVARRRLNEHSTP